MRVQVADELLVIALLLGGDFFTGSVLAASLTKLVLRFAESSKDTAASNVLRAEVSVTTHTSLFQNP